MKTLSMATGCEESSVVTMKLRGIADDQKRGSSKRSWAGASGSGVRRSHAQS